MKKLAWIALAVLLSVLPAALAEGLTAGTEGVAVDAEIVELGETELPPPEDLPADAPGQREEAESNTSGLAISKKNFPDANFRAYIKKKIDRDHNGKLSKSERLAVKKLRLIDEDMSNMKGIEYFGNLKTLICPDCKKLKIDVTKNAKLENLSCSQDSLKSINVKKNANLKFLDVDGNRLSDIDVTKNAKLQDLTCNENKLSELNVTRNKKLKELECYGNKLTSLNVTKNTLLTRLQCESNRLTKLDVSKNTKLTFLTCDNNRLSSLDLSKLKKLEYLDCSGNRLKSLDVKKNTKLYHLSATGNDIRVIDIGNCPNLIRCFYNSDSKVEDGHISWYFYDTETNNGLSIEIDVKTVLRDGDAILYGGA